MAAQPRSKEKMSAAKKAAKSKERQEKEKNKDPWKLKKYRHNWRTDMLAIPRGHPDQVEAFRKVKGDDAKGSEVSVKAASSARSLQVKKSKRLIPIEEDKKRLKRMEQMALAPARLYTVQKHMFGKQCGKTFEDRMNDRLKKTHHTMYHEYDLARIALKKKKKLARLQKGKRGGKEEKAKKKGKKGRKSKEHESVVMEVGKAKSKHRVSFRMQARLRRKRPFAVRLKEAIEWCKENSLPKKCHKPQKIERGSHIDIASIEKHLHLLSTPKFYYISPSQDSLNIVNRSKVKPSALRYRITEKTANLAKPVPRVLFEPRKLGEVVPESLTAKPSPRTLELAVPKPKSAKTDTDLNEDAFKISPNALKYVASPRILELAKPVERD